MLRIPCPYCGLRDFTEFVYGGDASNRLPDLADDDVDRWVEHVLLRDNPVGLHAEHWQHQSGCRQWLRVVRNTVTHVIESVSPSRDYSWSDTVRE